MIVSHFELLVKRIAPLIGYPAVDAAFRRVVQGYFLKITNLNNTRKVRYQLRFVMPAVPNTMPNRLITTANAVITYDMGPANNINIPIAQVSTNTSIVTLATVSNAIELAPYQTCSIALLPNLTTPNILTSNNYEVRGYVELRQIPRTPLESISGMNSTKVLLTPEIRGTFLDNDYPTPSTSNELDFDQINFGIPLFSGKSENEVEAFGGYDFSQSNPTEILASELKKRLGDSNEKAFTEAALSKLNSDLEEMGNTIRVVNK